MNEQQIKQSLHELAECEVPNDLDMWTAIRTRRTATERIRQRQTLLRLRLPLAICCVLFALLTLPAVVPSARAAVEHMLQRFGFVVVDSTLPTRAPLSSPASATAVVIQAEPFMPQQLSRTEAQQRVPFPIHLPTRLPTGVILQSLSVGTGSYACSDSLANCKPPAAVYVMYGAKNDAAYGHLSLDIIEGKVQGGYVVSQAATQAVSINDHLGSYVVGAWTKDQTWDATVDVAMLSWEQNGATYLLRTSGLGLGHEEIIRIAESLH